MLGSGLREIAIKGLVIWFYNLAGVGFLSVLVQVSIMALPVWSVRGLVPGAAFHRLRGSVAPASPMVPRLLVQCSP